MGYDIYWTLHSKFDKEEDEKELYTDEEKKILARHSKSFSLYWETDKPFDYESSGLNVTSNLCRMFNWALSGDEEVLWRNLIDGKKGSEISPYLENAVLRMERERDQAVKYESDNGWGTYSGGLQFLIDLWAESIYYKNFYLDIGY